MYWDEVLRYENCIALNSIQCSYISSIRNRLLFSRASLSLGSAVSGKMTGLTALEAVSLSGGSSLRSSLAVWAISSEMSELAATEAVSTSGTLDSLNWSVGAVSGHVTGFTASVAVVRSGTLASSLSSESRTSLRAVSGEVVGFTAVEAVSSSAAHGSGSSLALLGAVAGHVSLSTAGETVRSVHFL